MHQAGRVYRAAGVREIVLVHGTFVGPDALGVLAELGRIFPAVSQFAAQIDKSLIDQIAGDAGNYTEPYAQGFQAAISTGDEPAIAVNRFHWSSQNNHLGRADGAIRLIDWLASRDHPGRVLLWGHSHAGNVFALLTNLLAADREILDRFFKAAQIYYRSPWFRKTDVPVWQRVRQRLLDDSQSLREIPLDIVTFGTPIRYGWDTLGCDRLLHFVNHRSHPADAPHRALFPPTVDQVLQAYGGDYVQQVGIAGTNLAPSMLAWRSRLADRRLNALLQPGIRCRDLVDRLRTGTRVAQDGTTLLVDYGSPEGNLAQHLAGHAVYTRQAWLLFHAEEVAQRFYTQEN